MIGPCHAGGRAAHRCDGAARLRTVRHNGGPRRSWRACDRGVEELLALAEREGEVVEVAQAGPTEP